MALLIVLKTVAVCTSYGSGNAGGIFGPSLFIGAMLGGAVGTVAHHFLPMHTANSGAYALVGMGTVFAGVVRAPMTSVLMIFETTRDYSVIVPLMISNLVSLFISSRLQHRTIYDALSLQDGIHLPSAESLRESGQRQVSNAMIASTDLLTSELTVQDAMQKISISKFRAWPVVNKRGLIGVVSLLTLEKELALNPAKPLSGLVNSTVFPHVHADQSLDLALNRMGTEQLELLPVVNRANIHKLEGVITLSDVLNSYGVGKRGAD